MTPEIEQELEQYGEWIKKYRAREIGEIKMQKIRLQIGTYHQRQEGVQMQRIKLPGGVMSSEQLTKLADVSDQFASGFIHFTTREDAQLYYVQLENCPDMLRELYKAGITTREACGNTVRNITAGYRGGIAPGEAFDATPYAEALFKFLVRNKYNQVMGRKVKIAFESAPKDLSGVRYHDLGFHSVIKDGKKGFRVFVGGGLGATPMLGHLYTDFLPVEELLHLSAATVRIFDRYGERKNRMAARMKYLVKKLGWDKFKSILDEERTKFKLDSSANDYLIDIDHDPQPPALPGDLPANPEGLESDKEYQQWLEDNVVDHKFSGYKGVLIRLSLGDILSDPARALAQIAETFSHNQLRISPDQNLFLPWVPETALPALYTELKKQNLASAGAETLEDTTTCPGADTCRLGITSAKGLGSSISSLMKNGLAQYREYTKDIRIKISGCPNNCATHGIASIGFQGAALKKDGKSVPTHELFVGGQVDFEHTTLAFRLGKYPAKNCPTIVETLVKLYAEKKQDGESFSACMQRFGADELKEMLKPFLEIPSFDEKPDFYQDWGHDNESFTTRIGVKGECAGAPVQEKAPVIEDAKEKLNQAEAFLKHKEYGNAQLEAYEAMAEAARVPLYAGLIDPFTSEQALWEFENIFVLTGKTNGVEAGFSQALEDEKEADVSEEHAQDMINRAKSFISLSENLFAELTTA